MSMGFFDYLSTSVGYILGFIIIMTILIIWATKKESMNSPTPTHMKQINRKGVRRDGIYTQSK